MILLLASTLIALAPTSRAEGPPPVAACSAELVSDAGVPREMSSYTKWLLDDGVARPTRQLEVLLDDLLEVDERDFMDDVADLLGKPGAAWKHMKKMGPFGRQLGALAHGYEALDARCGRIANELALEPALMHAMIARSEAITTRIRTYLDQHPGRDTDWVRRYLVRAERAVANFRTQCHENPPQGGKPGLFESVRRWLAP